MNKNLTLTEIIIAAAVGALLVVSGWLMSFITPDNAYGVSANTAGEPTALIGSRTGTTTTGVSFYTRTSSTTYPVLLGADKKDVTLYIESLATTSTSGNPSGHATFSILASNDTGCDSATTSPDFGNPILKSDITWFDAASNVKGATGLTALATATTTFGFPTNGSVKGRTLTLEGLTAKCLSLEVAASSSVIYGELMTK